VFNLLQKESPQHFDHSAQLLTFLVSEIREPPLDWRISSSHPWNLSVSEFSGREYGTAAVGN
jgi:hypothetical protein